MSTLHVETDPRVDARFADYPQSVKAKMEYLRQLVIATAKETKEVTSLEETLRWGEPSFITNCGSTLRMDWKAKSPDRYAMYFQCTSRLVDTFRLVFDKTFEYEGKRAIVFCVDAPLPEEELRKCIKATLRYHTVKEELTLGI